MVGPNARANRPRVGVIVAPMRRAYLAILTVVLVSCSPATEGGPPPKFTDADRGAIETLLADQATAWNEGDLVAFMAGYEQSEDLVFTSGAKIRRGWETTRKRYEDRYGSGQDSNMGKLAFEILDVRALGADGAIVLGKWKLTETPEAGGGVFSLGMVRTPEGWRIVHDHTSSEES